MGFTENMYRVYVQIDDRGCITAINSSAFVNAEWGTEIDQGFGDQYHHAQNHYLDGALYTVDGIPCYKLVAGQAVERTAAEVSADRGALSSSVPTLDDRVETLKGDTAELHEALNMILTGVTE